MTFIRTTAAPSLLLLLSTALCFADPDPNAAPAGNPPAEEKPDYEKLVETQIGLLNSMGNEDSSGPSYEKEFGSIARNALYQSNKAVFATLQSEMMKRQQAYHRDFQDLRGITETMKKAVADAQKDKAAKARLIGADGAKYLAARVRELQKHKSGIQVDHSKSVAEYSQELKEKIAELQEIQSARSNSPSDAYKQLFGKTPVPAARLEAVLKTYPRGVTGLMLAARNLKADPRDGTMELLTKHLANIDAVDSDGKSALQHSLDTSNSFMFNWLAAHQANPKVGAPNNNVQNNLIRKLSWGAFEEIQRFTPLLFSLIKLDRSPEKSVFAGLLENIKIGSGSSLRGIVDTFMREVRQHPEDPDNATLLKAHTQFINKTLDKAELGRVLYLAADLKGPKGWENFVTDSTHYIPDGSAKVLAENVRPGLSSTNYREISSILVKTLVKQQGGAPYSPMYGLGNLEYNHVTLNYLVNQLLEADTTDLNAGPEGKKLINQVAKNGDVALLQKLLDKKIPITPSLKINILTTKNPKLLEMAYSRPPLLGPEGDHVLLPNSPNEISAILALADHPNLETYLKTRTKIVLPDDLSQLNTAHFVSALISADRLTNEEFLAFAKSLPPETDDGTVLDIARKLKKFRYVEMLLQAGFKTQERLHRR